MTSNKLKIIACISMVLDHIGYLLFPNIILFRYLGRIALPIFAFFIAEGCLFTRNKIKYFLQVFALAIICQTFYIGEALTGGKISSIYLNVLFTFCLSMLCCCSFIKLTKEIQSGNKKAAAIYGGLFILAILFSVFCCTMPTKLFGIKITVDYGIIGVLLPLFAVVFKDKNKRFICFSLGVVVYCIARSFTEPYVWFALLTLPLMAFYNGERGSKKLKWAFYLFYPLHFAVIYGISLLK